MGSQHSSEIVDGVNSSPSDIAKQWENAEKCHKGSLHYEVNTTPGIKTVRIFVSSTFEDFFSERDILVKEVMPELRTWCRQRNVDLIECDLRWGIPAGTSGAKTIRTCLGEIDRCQKVNYLPFFINMTGERSGWVPTELPKDLTFEYNWVFGMSLTEMEIMHGAYWIDNPNALFLLRDYSFLETVPPHLHSKVSDDKTQVPRKVDHLRKQLTSRFSNGRCKTYSCQYESYNKADDRVRVTGLDSFKEIVLEFFKKQIARHYPESATDANTYTRQSEAQQAFMENRINLIGRKTLLKRINDYLTSPSTQVLLVVGDQGVGKSSIMAEVAKHQAYTRRRNCRLFYHFVGAAPGSTDLLFMLKRFLKSVFGMREENIPTETKELMKMVKGHLAENEIGLSKIPGRKPLPIVIIIDAINQMSCDSVRSAMMWLPHKLKPYVKIVLSTISDDELMDDVLSRSRVEIVSSLDKSDSQKIVKCMLKNFSKALNKDDMCKLVGKSSSDNPLWLSIACEELRVHGNFKTIQSKIDDLPGNVNDLWIYTLERMEKTAFKKYLIVATLSLIETSKCGLLESELRDILASCGSSYPNIEARAKPSGDSNTGGAAIEKPLLTSANWANVYGLLGNFLRPFGGNCEGRLDFYHSSLSRAVRQKYFDLDDLCAPIESVLRKDWHRTLADYFESCDDLIERKMEEYPYHLVRLLDTDRLASFLVDWRYVEILCRDYNCVELLRYWRHVGTYSDMKLHYNKVLLDTAGQRSETEHKSQLVDRYLLVSQVFTCSSFHDDALDLLQKALNIEKESLCPREVQLCRIYELFVQTLGDKAKLLNTFNEDYRSLLIPLFNHVELAIKLKEKDLSTGSKYSLGWLYHAYAFSLNAWSRCMEWLGDRVKAGKIPVRLENDIELSQENATVQARIFANKAIEVFKNCNEPGSCIDAEMTLAMTKPRDDDYIKALEDIIQRCSAVYGDKSLLMETALFNLAITHHYWRNDGEAYGNFRAVYLMRLELYGIEHSKTRKVADILLNEEFDYIKMSELAGQPVLPVLVEVD